jgi:aryl-alcohol dehydrogenase-like predicted oxidoreductase
LVRKQMALHLRHRVHRDADDDGATSAAQIHANVAAASWTLSAADMAEIDTLLA